MEKKFRLYTRYFTVTYAGSPNLTKERILSFFRDEQDGTLKPDYCMVSQEISTIDPEKGVHFHVYVRYPKSKNLINPRIWDIDGFHPNIQGTKSVENYLEYMQKEDPNPISFGELTPPPTPREIMNNVQLFRAHFRRLRDANPFSFNISEWISKNEWDLLAKGGYLQWIREHDYMQEVHASILLKAKVRPMKLLPESRFSKLMKQWDGFNYLFEYINEIISRPNTDESNMWIKKRKHLFLVGEPDTGKTTLVDILREFFPVYPFGAADKWWPKYTIFTYSIIEWGEFSLTSQAMPFGELLKLLGGEQMNLPVKGSNVFKMDRQAFILSSNRTLAQHAKIRFPSESERAALQPALESRIHELVIPSGVTLFPFIEALQKELRR